jgi:GlpG protein
MRKLASFDDLFLAEALTEVLYASDIVSELRPGPDNTLVLWIESEPDLERARGLTEAFVADPDNPRYDAARAAARAKREALKRSERGSRHKVVEVRKTFRDRAAESPVTLGLLVACIAVAFATQAGTRTDLLLRYLSIVRLDQMDGEIWRVVTPVLIHFGPFHLLFNAFWLNDLGAPTERYQGSWRFLGFILWSSAISNLAQLYLGGNPNFGGLSGLIYALVGYLWARGRADPRSGIAIPNRLVGFFAAWMILGFTGLLTELVGQMANYCHLGGFAAGALYGYIAALIATRRARR